MNTHFFLYSNNSVYSFHSYLFLSLFAIFLSNYALFSEKNCPHYPLDHTYHLLRNSNWFPLWVLSLVFFHDFSSQIHLFWKLLFKFVLKKTINFRVLKGLFRCEMISISIFVRCDKTLLAVQTLDLLCRLTLYSSTRTLSSFLCSISYSSFHCSLSAKPIREFHNCVQM